MSNKGIKLIPNKEIYDMLVMDTAISYYSLEYMENHKDKRIRDIARDLRITGSKLNGE